MYFKIGRNEYFITEEDSLFFNGACYQLITKKTQDGWAELSPKMSKTQFNKLFKVGALVLTSEKFAYTTADGRDIIHKYYKFDMEKLEAMSE